MKKLLLLLVCLPILSTAQVLTSSTSINITKTWSQEPSGYTYPISISVPAVDVPTGGFPVCILLHGNGGNGAGMVNQFSNIIDCHALVAPTGYQSSWNICGEASDAPDVEMVTDLVNMIQGYTNINPNQIRILGSSNGAGLANNVFIQNTNAGIDIVCTIVSQLNEPQYHLDNFYSPSSVTDDTNPYCSYDVLNNPLTTRKYLSIANTNDPIIPYTGGTSVVGVDFLDAEVAAYTIAANQGYMGSQIMSGTTIGNPAVTEYSYLSGSVVHIKGDAGHATNETQRDYIKNYFSSNCETVVSQVSCPPISAGAGNGIIHFLDWPTSNPDAESNYNDAIANIATITVPTSAGGTTTSNVVGDGLFGTAPNQAWRFRTEIYSANTFIPSPFSGDITLTLNDESTQVCTYLNNMLQSNPLAVETTMFTGEEKDGQVKLFWETTTESGNYGFEIERGAPNFSSVSWEQVGFIASEGTTTAIQQYTFIDQKPISGINYYRLKQIDDNGKYTYSSVVAISYQQQSKMYPTLVQEVIFVEATDEIEQIEIYDTNGRKVKVIRTNGDATAEVNVRDLSTGIFLLVIKKASLQSESFRFVKQRL